MGLVACAINLTDGSTLIYSHEMSKPSHDPSDYSPTDIEWAAASELLPNYYDLPPGTIEKDGWAFKGGAFWRVKRGVTNAS